ncbi:anti-codon nuclease masking agent (prrB) [Helicobacter pylori]|uniref:restriction endonuclease subunit S n=1 Tax=Helicobacter pylori TaxID=210 RepID=UPI001AAA3483|nr:restriction endonuclease subunit S [Helicobacter pylori]GHQ07824.1 anti-codon nuclease masking agent (prrB) [Helicobacter pylori]
MHKIERLLQTLAPKGVEFKTLEEVFEIKNGYTPSKNNPEFWEKGTIPWFRMEDIRENGRILKDSIQHITLKALKGKKLFPKNSIIISTTATIGEHALLIVDSLANQRFTFLSKKANCDIALDMKFFFYQCFLLGEWCKKNTNVSGFASVDMTAFKKYKFPIPPLEIQQEIVKILDQFSILTTDLLAGIPAEIEARKKQYQYYQNMLLDFKGINLNHKDAKMSAKTYRLKTLLQTLAPKGVEFRKLGEVCDFQKGKSITKKAVTFGKVPVISGGRQPAYYHNEANRSGETIAISSSGVYAGYVSYWDIPVFLADSFSVSPKQKTLMPKYLFHYLTTQQDAIHAIKSTGGIPHVYSKDLQNFLIPIPPLEIQQEIVKILDQFLALTTDLLAGIPAEIEARKKQYEYYREKLLTFKPLTPHKEVKKC